MKIIKPSVIIDKAKVLANIQKLAHKAQISEVTLRPHFKTHQSAEIGKWHQKFGVNSIAVSSISMAYYFADNGWDDILVAIPVNINEIEEINQLAERISLHLIVDSLFTTKFLTENITQKVNLWIEVDTGYNRTGLSLSKINKMLDIIEISLNAEFIEFFGLLSHAGNTYAAKSKEEILSIYKHSVRTITEMQTQISQSFPDKIRISLGDTPSFSIIDDIDPSIDEIRPGNFVFYDLTQKKIGSCNYNEIAICTCCPIISINLERCEFVIYGGGIHLSKEFLLDSNNRRVYGEIVLLNSDFTWNLPVPNAFVSSLSQEHGIIHAPKEFLEELSIGDIVGILPVHSCMTANLFESMFTTDGIEIGSYQYGHKNR